MGTKTKPSRFDCYEKALPDESVFVLLGRDPDFRRLVDEWADRRERDIRCGDRPKTDQEMVEEARACAREGAKWRRKNNGRWRETGNKPPTEEVK